MKKFSALTLFIILSLSSAAQPEEKCFLIDPKATPREHNVDMQHMRLEVGFEPAKGKVIGKVTHYFKPLFYDVDTLFLDAPGITIKSAFINGMPVTFKTNDAGVTLRFDRVLRSSNTDSLMLEYEATPKKGLYFIGWTDTTGLCRKQIWSQGQAEDNRYWIPCFDSQNDKLTTEVLVDIEDPYKVLSNGTFINRTKAGSKNRWHYKMTRPHTTYLVMIGVGIYDVKEEKSSSGVPMQYWYYPEYKDRVEASYRYSSDMMDFFEKEIGVPYPWESYAQIPVQDFMYGAMENTTATVFGDFYLIDERSYLDRPYVGTNAHELAHQWFGDLVTARTLTHHWLQESFATHYNAIYERKVFGNDYYDWTRRNATNAAIEASKKNFYPIAYSDAGTTRHYPKGAHVLHMVKYVVGTDAYNYAVKTYLEKHKYANVDSEDLLLAFSDALGVSLDWFWEEWVYRGGEPFYSVNYKAEPTKTTFNVKQTHPRSDVVGLFKMPFVFEVHYTDGTKDTLRTIIEKEETTIAVPNNKGKTISYTLFDPNSNVMKLLEFTKTEAELKAQAENAKYMIDRYDALVGLRNVAIENKRDFLIARFGKETFHAPKAEIISQLIGDDNTASIELIRKAINDKDDDVRKAVIANLAKTIPSLEKDLAKLVADPSYDLCVSALDKLSSIYPTNIPQYLKLSKDIVGTRGRNVEIKWLELSAQQGSKESKDKLVNYTSISYEFITRVNAFNALKKVNYLSAQSIKNAFSAILNTNTRLSGPVKSVLKSFTTIPDVNKLIATELANSSYSSSDKEILRKAIYE